MSAEKVWIGLLLAVVLPLTAQAENQPVPHGPAMMGPGVGSAPGMMAPPAPRPFAGVEFTEQQAQKIQEMMEQERQAHQQRVEKMQAVQQQLRQLYMAELWDAAAITKLYEQMHAEQRKTIAAMAEARNKVYALMNKEQREQMKQHQQEQMRPFAAPPQP